MGPAKARSFSTHLAFLGIRLVLRMSRWSFTTGSLFEPEFFQEAINTYRTSATLCRDREGRRAVKNADGTDQKKIRGSWLGIVEKYIRCQFTKTSDRLPALAGLARDFSRLTQDRFITGLWQSYIVEGLSWFRSASGI